MIDWRERLGGLLELLHRILPAWPRRRATDTMVLLRETSGAPNIGCRLHKT